MNVNKRKCIYFNKSFKKEKLIRVVKLKDGNILVNSNALGRGAYILKDNEAIKNVINKKLLHKCFRMQVSVEVYKKLEKYIKE